MGKHSAADDAVVHPIVATALQHRIAGGAPPRPPLGGGEGTPVGWPQEPRRGDGVGWPVETADDGRTGGHPEHEHPDDDGSVLAALDAAAAAEPAPHPAQTPTRRGGWRRLFGGGGRSTSAA